PASDRSGGTGPCGATRTSTPSGISGRCTGLPAEPGSSCLPPSCAEGSAHSEGFRPPGRSVCPLLTFPAGKDRGERRSTGRPFGTPGAAAVQGHVAPDNTLVMVNGGGSAPPQDVISLSAESRLPWGKDCPRPVPRPPSVGRPSGV